MLGGNAQDRKLVDAQGRVVRVGPYTMKYLAERSGSVPVLGTNARTGEPLRTVVIAAATAGGSATSGGEMKLG